MNSICSNSSLGKISLALYPECGDSVDNTVVKDTHCCQELQHLRPNPNVLVAVNKGMQTVKLCTNKILQFLLLLIMSDSLFNVPQLLHVTTRDHTVYLPCTHLCTISHTCLYSPAAGHHCTSTGTHFLSHRGRVNLGGLVTCRAGMPAQRRVMCPPKLWLPWYQVTSRFGVAR